MNKHTPGPWKCTDFNDFAHEPDEYHIFIEPNVAVIEKKVKSKNQHDWADAHLIAAAPDLLKALQSLLEEGEFNDYPNTKQWYAVQSARAAIAKATGETE